MMTLVRIIAWILKMLVRILLIPVTIALTVLYWIGTIAVGISAWFLDLIGGLFIMTGLLSCGFGLEPVAEMWRLVAIGTGFLLAPMVLSWVVERLAVLSVYTKLWISS